MDGTLTQLLQQLYAYSAELDQLRPRVAQLEIQLQQQASAGNGTPMPERSAPSPLDYEVLAR